MPIFAALRFEPTNRPVTGKGDSKGEKRQMLDGRIQMLQDRAMTAKTHSRAICISEIIITG
jgi:hypothetical protein